MVGLPAYEPEIFRRAVVKVKQVLLFYTVCSIARRSPRLIRKEENMRKNRITPFMVALMLMMANKPLAFGIDISVSDNARLDIVSRTTFGIDLDNPYRYGLSNELTQFDLVFGLAPYQKLSNKLNTTEAVGFINVTLFNLDLVQTVKGVGYNAPGGIGTNRYQTGEFLAGIAKGPWLIQLNAMGNEPFTAPWNKGLEFVNDSFKLSWAYLDSMVDVRRILSISGVPAITRRGEENMIGDGDILSTGHTTMKQFGFDTIGNIADRLAERIDAQMIAAMYNSDFFGINAKFGTQYSFEDTKITEDNKNGLAMGIDSVFRPLEGLKIFFSAMSTVNWGLDTTPNPLLGGTRIGYTIPLNDDISVEPWTGIDMGIDFRSNGGTTKPRYEYSLGATMHWPGQGGWLKDYILNSDGRVFPGMSIGYKIYEDQEQNTGLEHSLKFTMFEPRGDEGLFFGLGSEIIIDLVDLTEVTKGAALDATVGNPEGGFRMLGTAYFDYALPRMGRIPGNFVPWTILYYDNLPDTTDVDKRINDMKIDLGINLENAIANTTFGIVWNTGSLIQQTSYHWGYIRLIAEIRL
jgi:hypothetical protein